MKQLRLLAITAFACAIIAALNTSANAASANPYTRVPAKGDSVRFDGSVGGERFGWGFYNEYWLQVYLRFTMEAARNPSVFNKSQAALTTIGEHSLMLPNGTRGIVEEVKNFQYASREDVQVRVMVQSGDLRGSEVWTTAGELLDSSGKNYLKP